MAQIAKIAVSAATYAIDRPYDYLVPSQLEGALGVGMRAAVPFGRGNKACDGVVLALEEREGYYLFKEMTCLPEEVDSEYQAVFKEMETTCGIEVSVMEDLGRHSQ